MAIIARPDLRAIDSLIGKRIRVRRIQLGMTQQQLGAKLGVTFQQVQKYEKGLNRIAGSRTTLLATALQVSEGYFFGLNSNSEKADAKVEDKSLGLLTIHGALGLVQDYANMKPSQRKAVAELCASMVGRTPAEARD